MTRRRILMILCVLAAASLGVGIAVWLSRGNPDDMNETLQEVPYAVPEIRETYESMRYGFRLGLPNGYTATELPQESGGHAIVLQDAAGNGIQILVSPYPEDLSVLTAEMVRRDIPDMAVTDVQDVEIGEGHRGIAFMSDNEAFGGASREVWFVYAGHLFQISTYARLDELLKAMFASWQFTV